MPYSAEISRTNPSCFVFLIDRPIRVPIWFEPVANGGTPMCAALTQAKGVVDGWVSQHPNCFPPIVIQISAGESTDGGPAPVAEQVRKVKSSAGEVVLFNVH